MLFVRIEIIILFNKRNSLMLGLRASDCILTNGSFKSDDTQCFTGLCIIRTCTRVRRRRSQWEICFHSVLGLASLIKDL